MAIRSGKTRAAFRYTAQKMAQASSVAYITESDALAGQVIAKVKEIEVEAAQILGANSESAPWEIMDKREKNLQDYDTSLLVPCFNN